MAKNTNYKLMMEIAGKVDGSFNSAVGGAGGKVGKLQGIVKKFAGYTAAAFAAKKVVEFGVESVKAAMKFEDSMSDVAKVVDGLKTATGKNTDEFYKMGDAIQKLSLKIPMTSNDIANIVASAGQAGIARKDLMKFAEDAAKMGIAFDTTAEQAGDWMAQWRTSMGLSQTQVENLADQVNYLGNTSSEKATKIAQVVSDIGSLGKMAGLTGGQVAALGAATTGIDASTSGTGIKAMITAMTAGSSATAKQQGVLKKLGLTSKGVAQNMQKDAEGTIVTLLKRINQLPKAEQAAAIKNYFGKQSLQVVAKLAGKEGLANLQKQFESAGSAAKYSGSMQKEFEARSSTTSNSLQLLNNSLDYIKVTIGSAFLPYIAKAAKLMASGLSSIGGGLKKTKPYFSALGKVALPVFKAIGSIGKSVWKELKPIGSSAMTMIRKMMPVIKALGTAFMFFGRILGGVVYQRVKSAMTNIFGVISGLIRSAMKVIGGICDFLTGVFTGNWRKAWQGLVDIVKGIFGGLAAVLKAPINAVIGTVNGLIGGINGIKFNIAGHKFGGTHIPTIPLLAKGGIVTSPTLAMIGEAGPEAVTPLGKGGGLGATITFAPNITISGNADRKDIESAMSISFEEFKRLMDKYEKGKKRVSFA